MTRRRDIGIVRIPPKLRRLPRVVGVMLALTAAGVVIGQDAGSVTPPPAPAQAPVPTPPATETPPPSTDPLPADPAPAPAPPRSLDELLGIEGESESQGEAAVGPPAGDPALDAALGGGSLDDMFQRALDGMRQAAGDLEERRTGLDTQRTQEEVMRRLEMLIDEARRQQQQRQSSSSSSSSSSQQQQQQPQQDPGSQQSRSPSQSQAQAAAEAAANGTEPQDGENAPSFQDGPLDGAMAESGEEWGALPQRVREMLLQGRSDRFSSLYERLTRAYYRRLAEEAAP